MHSTDTYAATTVRRMTELRAYVAQLTQYVDDRPNATYRDDSTENMAGRVAELAAQLAGGEFRANYSGWKNRETWNASLWISNEQPMYESAREIIRASFEHYDPDLYEHRAGWSLPDHRNAAVSDAADEVRDWYRDSFGPAEEAGPASDAWSYAVAVADWPAIVEGLAEDIDLPDQDEQAADAAEREREAAQALAEMDAAEE